MHKVYSNATLNLSASGARDASEGLFFDRDPAEIGPHPLCPWSDDLGGPFPANDYTGTSWHLVHEDFYGELLQKTAVFHRAWIFQERQLSKRVLHFGREQIFWECCTAHCCETFPEGLPAVLTASTKTLPKSVYEQTRWSSTLSSTIHHRLPGIAAQPARVQIQMVWQALFTDYSSAKLTYSHDKLVAISGMARDVWNTWQGKIEGRIRYIAGLWDIHLPETLLWRSTRSDNWRTEDYRAPTWSWAAVDGAVAWEERIWSDAYSCATTVQGVDVQHMWDEWGEVASGYIVVKGPLRKLRYKELHIGHLGVGPDQGENTECNVALYRDAGWGTPTETWDDCLYGLLVVRFHNLSLRRSCMIALIRLPGLENTFSRVGMGYPMFGSEVKDWFDGCSEETIKIV